MQKISACLVVYNEEKYIRRCLDSIKGVVDEIILVHDGECSDQTLEIAKKYTDKIFVRKHVGVAEPHRAFSFNMASGDWILQIDADEFIDDGDREAIKKLLESGNADGYELLWPIWDGAKELTHSWPHKLALFRKDKLTYLPVPNYVAQVDGKVVRSELILHHQPAYNNYTYGKFMAKWVPWTKLHAMAYLNGVDGLETFNYHSKDWPSKVLLRLKWPLVLIPLEFFSAFIRNIIGKSDLGDYPVRIKIGFMLGVYRAMVNYYIFIYKHYASKMPVRK